MSAAMMILAETGLFPSPFGAKFLRKSAVVYAGTEVEPAEDVQIHLALVKSSAATWLAHKVSRAHRITTRQ